MSDQIQTVSYRDVGVGAVDRNRVLRNTYGLLALSLLPTVIGAWLGVSTGLHVAFSGILGMVLFLAIAFGFMYAIERTKDSAAGVGVLLAFTFFMGLMMSGLISSVLGFRNGPQLIMTAFGGTAGVFFVMASLATVIKRDLSGMGQWLFVGVIGLMLASIINVFVGSTTGMLVMPIAVQTSISITRGARAAGSIACDTSGANTLNRMARQAIQAIRARVRQCRVGVCMPEL